MSELDKEWLLLRMPKATEDDIWFFCEKVATWIIDIGLSQEIARTNALEMLKNRDKV